MRNNRDHDCTVVILIGEAPMLAAYFAELRLRGVKVVFASQADITNGRVRFDRRTVLIFGLGLTLTTEHLTALLQVCGRDTNFVSVDPKIHCVGHLPVAPTFAWSNVEWFVIETYRAFNVSAEGRIHFAREVLGGDDREWLAAALMACPNAIEVSSALLGLSRASFTRRLRRQGVTWHGLCDRLVLAVCEQCARTGKKQSYGLAQELGFGSVSALSRRLSRLGFRWRGVPRPQLANGPGEPMTAPTSPQRATDE
jgi:hypothetical protein